MYLLTTYTGGITITIKRIALLSIIVTYVLIVFGGYVASSESGMGCGPEWPLCNGKVIPVLQDETLTEFAHRFIGLILVILAVLLFMLIRHTNSSNRIQFASAWMICLLTFQVLAGAVVVVLDLPSIVVTIHLVTAMLFMLSLLWIFRAENQTSFSTTTNVKKRKKIITHLNVLLALLLLTIGMGAYIKHMNYGLACDWLNCGSGWLPVTGPQILQTLHRGLAFVTVIYIVFLTVLAFTRNWEIKVKTRMMFASAFVLLQVLSGVLTVITSISIPWAVVHLAIGTALFMILADTRIILDLRVSSIKRAVVINQKKHPLDRI